MLRFARGSSPPTRPECVAGLQNRHEEAAPARRAPKGKHGGAEPTSWRNNDVAVPVPATGRSPATARASSSMRIARGSVAMGRISESDRREVVERAAGLLRRKQAADQQAALTEGDINRVVSSVVVRRGAVCLVAWGLRGAVQLIVVLGHICSVPSAWRHPPALLLPQCLHVLAD